MRRGGKPGSTGCSRCRCSMSWATGPRSGPACGRAAGRFNTPTPHYPDLDDTAVVAMAMDRAQRTERERRTIARRSRAAREWVVGLQSRERRLGRLRRRQHSLLSQQHSVRRSWRAARPADRRRHRRAASRCWRNSARRRNRPALARLEYLRRTQRADGSWYGRWGINYIYGTWSALCALQRRRRRPRDADDAPGRGLADRDPERRTAAGARTAPATGSTTAATSRRRARPRRPPGRCSD